MIFLHEKTRQCKSVSFERKTMFERVCVTGREEIEEGGEVDEGK